MADLAPQFANLQDRLSVLAAPPVPPGPPGAPPVSPMLPAAEAAAAGGGNTDIGSILSSPWLWVAIVVLILIGLFFWYKSQKKKND